MNEVNELPVESEIVGVLLKLREAHEEHHQLLVKHRTLLNEHIKALRQLRDLKRIIG
jgi:hypothetical protein